MSPGIRTSQNVSNSAGAAGPGAALSEPSFENLGSNHLYSLIRETAGGLLSSSEDKAAAQVDKRSARTELAIQKEN